MTSILWLRRDLRIHDNPALIAAREGAERLVPVFCFDERLLHGRHSSGPRTQFLLESLADLAQSLHNRGSGLVVRRGDPERELPSLARQVGASAVHFSADVGPFARARDERVARALEQDGVATRAHPGLFVVDDPESVRTIGGDPFEMFTPFHRAWQAAPRRDLAVTPRELPSLPGGLERGELPTLSELGLRQEIADAMPGGERAGRARMLRFVRDAVDQYGSGRNQLAGDGSSKLSPYLHFGCISPRELEAQSGSAAEFVRQVCWRDFYAQVLLHSPRNAHSEHQERYRGSLRYSHAEKLFAAWCEGRTGYPLVDAGMRQLSHEGWMHNRARLVVGSFLTKDLGIDWRWGERWFMRLLLDGDEANNNGNWQWIASVGVDPQPVTRRILNPARQRQRFDPEGEYVRRYVPELEGVPDAYLDEPWTMPEELQRSAGCIIGQNYPEPIVEHIIARRQTLERYAEARSG